MDFQDFKLYGLCVMRLKHQIALAKERGRMCNGRVVLESFCTGEPEEIVDLLEFHDLKDLKDISRQGLGAMLEELAQDASLFVREPLAFDYDESGELCLYLLEHAQVKAELAEAKIELETAGALTTKI